MVDTTVVHKDWHVDDVINDENLRRHTHQDIAGDGCTEIVLERLAGLAGVGA